MEGQGGGCRGVPKLEAYMGDLGSVQDSVSETQRAYSPNCPLNSPNNLSVSRLLNASLLASQRGLSKHAGQPSSHLQLFKSWVEAVTHGTTDS